jgi:hypothetical protein
MIIFEKYFKPKPMPSQLIKYLFVFAALVAVYFVGNRFITKSHSPAATAHHEKDGLVVTVEYCRPYKKNRVIFGGLVPYGKVWRTGANEATIIKFSKAVSLGNKKLPAGTYTLWTIPGATTWTVIINSEVGQWGTEYDETKDVLRFEVNAAALHPELEMLVIDFKNDPSGINMLIKWDNALVTVPVIAL